MSLTITINTPAPATLTVAVGTPGATGPAGAAGQGVPAGGTAGQFLTKINSTNYNTDWTTVNLSQYAVKANNLSDLASASTARTNLGLGTMATATASDYSTTTVANGLYYPLSGNPSAFITSSALTPYLLSSTAASIYQTLSGMSSYLTTSAAASTYAVTARGLPASGTVGQVLTKQSGTAYDATWSTIIPGDRYLTTSSTSNSVSNGAKTFTVGTGLSYTTQQDVTIAYDAAHHMHGLVLTYNSGTGVMTVDVNSHTGTGTYTAWTVNVGGTVPVASVVWGDITGTLGLQTDLATALSNKLEVSTAASTYLALAGGTMSGSLVNGLGATFDTEMSNTLFRAKYNTDPTQFGKLEYNGLTISNGGVGTQVTFQGITFSDATVQTTAGYPASGNPSGFIGDAPYDSTLYARYNSTWSAFSPGIGDATSDGQIYGRQSNSWTVIAGKPSYSEAVWIYNSWQSASIKNVYDPGSYSYYNVLTF